MTTNEREIAIREGHKIHAETSYFTPRPQLDFENARHVFCEGFDRGYISATTEANKRIAELESEVAELNKSIEKLVEVIAAGADLNESYRKTIAELERIKDVNRV